MDVYDHARAVPSTLRGQLLHRRYRDLREQGLTGSAVHWRTRRGDLRRPHHGCYAPADRPADLLDRVHAALLVAPPNAVVGHHTAACLLGFGVIASPDIHVVVPAGSAFPQRTGIVAHQVTVPIGQSQLVLGVPCVPAVRCAIDLARTVRRRQAIAVLDAALRAGGCSPESLRAEAARHGGLRGIRQVRELIPLADGRAECRQESQLRLVLRDGGITGFEPQLAVHDDYGLVRYRLDLADRARRVGAEYDGASHLDRSRLRHDRIRHNWLATRGWKLRYFTDHDLYRQPDRIVQVLRSTLSTPA